MWLIYINQNFLWLVTHKFTLYQTPYINCMFGTICIIVTYITYIVINKRLFMNYFVNTLNLYYKILVILYWFNNRNKILMLLPMKNI